MSSKTYTNPSIHKKTDYTLTKSYTSIRINCVDITCILNRNPNKPNHMVQIDVLQTSIANVKIINE